MTNRAIPLFSQDTVSRSLCRDLTAAGWNLRVLSTGGETASFVSRNKVFAGIMHFSNSAQFPLEAVEEVLLADPSVEWLALVGPAHLRPPKITRLLIDNFHDFHTHPVDPVRLMVTLGHAYGRGRLRTNVEKGQAYPSFGPIIGTSSVMQELYRDIIKMQNDDAPILITGESGTGKEVVAQAIHSGSMRRKAPFVAVNCGAIPAALIQSELFGHEKGAFTDAFQRKIGRFETAAGGTILLDEIGDLPLSNQVNLLRFLQEKSIERVGSATVSPVDVRVIAATNVDLESAVGAGRFREDLFYRLNVLRLHLPPLRARGCDIEFLAQNFLKRFSESCGKKVKPLSTKAIQALYDHSWPGNIRELINRVRRAVVMSEGRLITLVDLGLNAQDAAENLTLDQAREMAELAAVQKSLRRNNNNVSEAARQLGVSRVTLYRLMNKLSRTATFAARPVNHETEEEGWHVGSG